MGLSCMAEQDHEKIISRRIDKELKEQSQRFREAIKILLLGTGESGKTTIIKQMKILHVNGFTDEERAIKIKEIRQNIQESMYTLISQMPELGLDYDSSANKLRTQYILQLGENPNIDFPLEYYQNVKALWYDSGIQECYRRSNEFQLIDSAKYFLDKIDEVAQPTYQPNVDDILHARKMTTGIHEITFNVKMRSELHEFRMFDVGGQRDQRNKWLQVFEGIQAVLFIISCADFDQTLREDRLTNRLVESINLFSLVWHNRFLMTSGLIVFLNKQDLMEEKIKAGKSVGTYFPEYEQFRAGKKDGNVFDEAVRTKCFIRQQLINITKEPPRRRLSTMEYEPREVYYHFTVATDTNNIRTVFEDVRNMIIQKILNETGLN